MHIAMIIDDERLRRERHSLHRLSLALIDQGAAVTRIVSDDMAPEMQEQEERHLSLAARLDASMTVLPWMRRTRARLLLDAMEKSPPQVVYAVGADTIEPAIDLAAAAKCPVMAEVWSAAVARWLPQTADRIDGYVALTQPLAELLREQVDSDLVSVIPLGVPAPAAPRRVLDQAGGAIQINIIGPCHDMLAWRTMLEGLAAVMTRIEAVHAVVELRGEAEHQVWREMQRLNLLDRISTVADAAEPRALLSSGDVLVLPEDCGEVQSIMYECMAAGLPVVAMRDPMLDVLEPATTAVIIPQPDRRIWEQLLLRLLEEPETARAIGLAGRAAVVAHHRSTDQARLLMMAFQRVIHGGSLPFSPQAGPAERA